MSVPLRCRLRRWRQHPAQRVLLPIAIAILLLSVLFHCLTSYLRPMVKTVAQSEAKNLISTTVSQVVEECMSQQGLGYDDLMEMEQPEENGPITVTGRTAVIQQLRSQVTQTLVEHLENLDSGQLGIPLGNLTGWVLFSGIGPKLRVTVDSVGDVVTQVYNQFDSAGINQTHHQVLMDVSVTVHLFIPGEITSVTVDTTVCLAETIFFGTVPNSYFQTG